MEAYQSRTRCLLSRLGLHLGSVLFNIVDLNGNIEGLPTQLSGDTKLEELANASYDTFRIK